MAYNAKGKTYTDNPLLDEMAYNCKKILSGIVVKNDVLANNSETENSLTNAEMYYIQKEDDIIPFSVFPFTEEYLRAFGYTDQRALNLYIIDRNYIPEEDREALTIFCNQYFKDHFEEENNYYRTLNGLPPFGSGEQFYIYLKPGDFPAKYKKNIDYRVPLHQQPKDVVNILYNSGRIEKFNKEYPSSNYSYINFLGNRKIDLYKARKANKWDILYMPNVYWQVEDKFTECYQINRELYYVQSYQEAYSDTGDYYDELMIVMLLAQTFSDMVTDTPEWYIRRDIFDIRSVRYFLESYGIRFFKDIPLKYQVRIVKNTNKLIKFKSSNMNLEDIVALITTDKNVQFLKYWLYKRRQMDKYGNYIIPDDDWNDEDDEPIKEGDYDFGDLESGVNPHSVIPNRTDIDFDPLASSDPSIYGSWNFRDIDNPDDVDPTPEPVDPETGDYSENTIRRNRMNNQMYKLEFINSPLYDSYDGYIKDPIFINNYDDLTYQDKYWDGEDTHSYIHDTILARDFTVEGTKYMSIEYRVNLSEYLFQVQYFLGLILDSKVDLDDIRINVFAIDEDADFSLSNLFLYLIIVSDCYYRQSINDHALDVRTPDHWEGSNLTHIEDTYDWGYYDWKEKYLNELYTVKNHRVHAFNTNFDRAKMNDFITNGNNRRHSHWLFGRSYDNVDFDNPGKDTPLNAEEYSQRAAQWLEDLMINEFRVPAAKYDTVMEVIDTYRHNKKCYETLIDKIRWADDEDELATLAYVYQELYTREFDDNFYTLSDGTKAENLADILLDRDYVLWDNYNQIMQETNLEIRKDQIRNILNDVVATLEYYISGDGLEYLFAFTPIDSFFNIVYYIYLLAGFFKSYKVSFLDPYITYVVDDKMDPLDARMPAMDEINLRRNTYWREDKAFTSDNVTVEPDYFFQDDQHVKIEAGDIYSYQDRDPLEDMDYDGIHAEDGEASGYKDLNGGIADDLQNAPYEDIDAGKSYLSGTNMHDINGGEADEAYHEYYDINGGEAYHEEDEVRDWKGSQLFNYDIDGGSCSPRFFKSNSIQVDVKANLVRMNVVISNKEGNKITLLEDGLYIPSFLVDPDEYKALVGEKDALYREITIHGTEFLEDLKNIKSFADIQELISRRIGITTYPFHYALDQINGALMTRLISYIEFQLNAFRDRYADIGNPYGWESF